MERTSTLQLPQDERQCQSCASTWLESRVNRSFALLDKPMILEILDSAVIDGRIQPLDGKGDALPPSEPPVFLLWDSNGIEPARNSRGEAFNPQPINPALN